MKIGVIGLGLGYSLAKYLASFEHDIVGVDLDAKSFEHPRMDANMREWILAHDFPVTFTTDFSKLKDREIIMLFVSTPLEDGRISIRNVLVALSESLAINPDAHYAILSTLPIGAMTSISGFFPEATICYVPPMVKKHDFLSTFIHPPSGFQMFGGLPTLRLRKLYASIQKANQIIAPAQTVEAAKLSINLMLATKVIMANAIGDSFGEEVCEIVSQDPRIGKGYFKPGGPASGPCLPRDLMELEASTSGNLREMIKLFNRVNKTEEIAGLKVLQ